MKTQRQQRESRGQQAQMPQSNGLETLSGLVNLINASQAPGIQQQQFQQEMGFKGLGLGQQYEQNKAEWEQRAANEANQQYNQQRAYDLNVRQQQAQEDYYRAQDATKNATLQATMADRQAGDRMDFTKLLFNAANNPMGPGAINLNALDQLAQGLHLGGLINKDFQPNAWAMGRQQAPLDKSNIMLGVPNNEQTDAAFARRRGGQ